MEAVGRNAETAGSRAVDGLTALTVALGLVFVVSMRSWVPLWLVGPGAILLGLSSACAYLVAFTYLRSRAVRPVPETILVAVLAGQSVMVVVWLLDLGVSRLLVVAELTLLLVAIPLSVASTPRFLRVGAAGVLVAVAMIPSLQGLGQTETSAFVPGPSTYVFGSYHDLRVTPFTLFASDSGNGGGLTQMPDGRILVVAADGGAKLLSEVPDGLKVLDIELGLPIDPASYAGSSPEWYRVTGVHQSKGDLFASYTHWDSGRDCHVLRLVEGSMATNGVWTWETRYETSPCIGTLNNEVGGRIAELDSTRLLLSVGTFGQDAEIGDGSDLGKILVLDRSKWDVEVFSSGHRNPQGLLVLGDTIWSTEHGPHGGDELNRLEPGSDYGWPTVSYGTDYGQKTLASGRSPGDHSGFVQPVYSWTPSIGASSLIRASGTGFPLWRDDLLVGSLNGLGNGYSLYRTRIREARVVSVERIQTGRPVRDLFETPSGRILIWDGLNSAYLIEAADFVFSQCASCHGTRRASHGVGPDLFDIVGNGVARHEGFPYSDALRSYGGRWSEARLDRFLTDPSAEVPGTRMEFEGLSDPAQRASVIEFLVGVGATRP